MTTAFRPLITELLDVHATMKRIDVECASFLRQIPDNQQTSARNLLHYLALRRHDLRKAQPVLASCGLSSLGRTESHVQHGLEAVLKVLHLLEGIGWEPTLETSALTKEAGEILSRFTHQRALWTDARPPERTDHGDDARRGGCRLSPGP
jgi:pyruvate kinase